MIAPSLFYYSGVRTRSSKEEKSLFSYELKLGGQVYPNFLLAFTYQGEQTTTKTSGYSSDSLNNTAKGQRASFGPSVGYVTTSFHIIFTYFYDSKLNLKTTTSSGTSKYDYSGSGIQVDLGYKIPIWGFFFGPQLSYKSYTYGKLSTDGGNKTAIDPKLQESNLEPSIVAHVYF